MTPDDIVRAVQPYTMTSAARILATIRAVDTVLDHGIPGAMVECGVWRGGSMMAMALALLRRGVRERHLYLYDTFAGMTAPGEDVRRNLESTGYPPERMRFVRGSVEETIPRTVPQPIAVLRLDTDWYESTRQLVHLYPLLRPGGVLIIDDYGHWRSAREATDEYFRDVELPPRLERTDDTGVIAIKPDRRPS